MCLLKIINQRSFSIATSWQWHLPSFSLKFAQFNVVSIALGRNYSFKALSLTDNNVSGTIKSDTLPCSAFAIM